MSAATPRFFFLHVMKTGGATFRQHIYANFADGEVYPVPRQDDMEQAWLVDYLLGLPPERKELIRAFTGHFPYVATQLLDLELVTLTILRDPVERVISYLKHAKRYHAQHRDCSLDEIYDDVFYFECFMHNYQAKLFSMTTHDQLESHLDVIEVDDRRLALAKENLERIDVLGLNERYPEFLDEMALRYGWTFKKIPNRRVARESWEVGPALRRRISEDNAADVAFYEHAQQLHEQRRHA